jgi:DinB family protein
MAPTDRSEIIDILEKSREEFQAAAGGIPESLAKTRPEVGRWSVLECVEHVATVEEIFLKRLAGGEHTEAPPEDKRKEVALAARVVDRSTRRQAPEAILPKGRFTSLADGLEQFHAARGRTVQFARERAADLYTLASAHPVFGPLNGVEALTIIAAHARRHAEQIREVRAALEKR